MKASIEDEDTNEDRHRCKAAPCVKTYCNEDLSAFVHGVHLNVESISLSLFGKK